MIIKEREQQAYEVYIKMLKSKGFLAETLAIRAGFLSQLMPQLADKAPASDVYREVLHPILQTINEGKWPESLQIAREYYPFWTGDINAIIAMYQSNQADALPIRWKPAQVDLPTLWGAVDTAMFSRTDSWALKAYTKALHKRTVKQAQIEIQLKLVKLLLTRLMPAPDKDHQSYCVVADATHPLFTIKENRVLFSLVVREFFHFWSGNPNAEAAIVSTNYVNSV